jgi:hypothetical protein
MGAEHACCDSETESRATTGATAITFDSIERFEDLGELIFRDAGAGVTNGDTGLLCILPERDDDGALGSCVTKGVADDIFNRCGGPLRIER